MKEERRAAVTVVGSDRPGIVAGVTRVLYEHGCNLQDASSTILSGQFSMMLIVSFPPDRDMAELERDLHGAAADTGVSVALRPVRESAATAGRSTHQVTVYGGDKPGIVFRVSELLSSHGVNITDLSSRLIGPADQPVYALMLEVDMADGEQVLAGLDLLRQELEVDISVRAIDADIL